MGGREDLSFVERRTALLAATPPGSARRRALADLADGWLAELAAPAMTPGRALVAVGGLGRRELSPCSDLDLLFLHDGGDPTDVESIWYAIWDAGIALDHAVRTVSQTRALARDDLRVLLGVLDARVVAGEAAAVVAMRSKVLADWRRETPRRLADLAASVAERHERDGDLAGTLEPDLKDAAGGLRDVTVLRAIAASGLTDYPHQPVASAAARLLDVRDELHLATGRGHDRLAAQDQPTVADALGYGDADDLLRDVIRHGRMIAHASGVTWRRAQRVATPSRRRARLRRFEPAGDGLVVQAGEVALAPWADRGEGIDIALRAATVAATRRLPLRSSTLDRLADLPQAPCPWPEATLRAFTALLASGPGLVAVWAELDQVGVIERLLPVWSKVRHLPQRDPLHRFTVDRHQLETVVAACGRTRHVGRGDLLLLAALLHDIGKGGGGDHCELGAEIVAELAPQLGLGNTDAATLALLVRAHLLLPATATRRDLEDPATVRTVTDRVDTRERLELLRALSHADAAATGPTAASTWRRDLVDRLVARAELELGGQRILPGAPEPPPRAERPHVTVTGGPVWRIVVAVPGEAPLLGPVAGALASHRLSVHAASVGRDGDATWLRCEAHLALGSAPSPDLVRADVGRAVEGRLDVAGRLARREAAYATDGDTGSVEVAVADAADRATVVEVRATDRPGLLYEIATALTDPDVRLHRAFVSTLGVQATDVFYLTGPDGLPLADDVAARVASALRERVGTTPAAR